ncbi:MAG: 4Fe-4S binding protein, partial [Eubacterium sp.]|nr:4Fe-4S binding protein [Eubacterium sp.]
MREKLSSYESCTLCMACFNACPVDAIYIDCDSYGYEKIEIDNKKCIKCGKCEKVCAARNDIAPNTASLCYAAQANDREQLSESASGGAFQMLARAVLEKGGVCFGCSAD